LGIAINQLRSSRSIWFFTRFFTRVQTNKRCQWNLFRCIFSDKRFGLNIIYIYESLYYICDCLYVSSSATTRVWRATLLGIVLIAVLAILFWQRRQPLSLRGAILVQDSDPRKQTPIANVEISADGDLAPHLVSSDSSGLFVLPLWKWIRRGHPIVLHLRHRQYRPLDLNDFVHDGLYVVHLVPLTNEATPQNQPLVRVTNVRVRFTVEAMTELNVGSAATTFEIKNTGNVPCKGQNLCSPDGRWKAALGTGSLDAGPGRAFRDARVSCIAGPCPFTRIESDDFSKGGQTITVSARGWSDTATFLMEAEVARPIISATEHWSYPIIFGNGMWFTLPADAESVSMEADVDGQTIIFPLGPSVFLSWATCDSETKDKAHVYRCALRSGYRFN
jgi:hypothetical protein